MVQFNKMWFPEVLMLKVALMWSWSIPLYWHLQSRNNDRHILHTWLDKDYRLQSRNLAPGYIHNYLVYIVVMWIANTNSLLITTITTTIYIRMASKWLEHGVLVWSIHDLSIVERVRHQEWSASGLSMAFVWSIHDISIV